MSTSGQEQEDCTDMEDCNSKGFYIKKRNFGLPKYGNCAVYVTKSFTALEGKYKQHDYFRKNGHSLSASVGTSSYLSKGRIAHIVSTIDEPETLWFAFYDVDQHRRPPSSPEEWHYAKCVDFISSKMKMIKWDNNILIGQGLLHRTVSVYFGSTDRYYVGTVTNYEKEKKKPYEVTFEDGEKHSFSEKNILETLRVTV